MKTFNSVYVADVQTPKTAEYVSSRSKIHAKFGFNRLGLSIQYKCEPTVKLDLGMKYELTGCA